MALTLSVIAGLSLLLPGLFGVLFWNFRARRRAASRPDLPITAVSVLAFAIAISLVLHTAIWWLFRVGGEFALEIGSWVSAHVDPRIFGPPPAVTNPIETIVSLTHSTRATVFAPADIAMVAVTIGLEIALVAAIVNDEGFDLLLEGAIKAGFIAMSSGPPRMTTGRSPMFSRPCAKMVSGSASAASLQISAKANAAKHCRSA